MRATRFFISTTKEAPSEAELVSHKLMLRAGLIKRLGSGLYTWMPLGLRVLRRVEAIVREEMNRAGAIELLMPAVQPAELWEETGRWAVFGPQMLKIKDRHQRDFCFGPTHEEVITDVARREIKSYRQLPLNFYQIQMKFRDEIRPRFGVMRAREFLMKDAYSFHASRDSLAATYQTMYDAYTRIFSRLGLTFRAVAADTGAIGGSGSHEFHVLADSGEDTIAYCPDSDYAANVEMAEALAPAAPRAAAAEALREVDTPKQTACEDVAALLGIPLAQTVKLVAYVAGERLVAVLVRGDHEVNEVKLGKLAGMADVFEKRMRGKRDWFQANFPDQFIATDETCTHGLDGYRRVIEASDAVLIACASKYHAFYAEARDVTQAEVLADLAAGLGIDRDAFLRAFDSDTARAKTQAHFKHTRQAGVRGFPALILQQGTQLHPVCNGCQPLETVRAAIDARLAA
mgnify:CR=1 FL=1